MEDLAGLKYQETIQDVRGVFQPTEARFLAAQTGVQREAARVFQEQGADDAARFVTQYTNSCLDKVDGAYGQLVDYLMFKYLYSYADVAPPERR